MDYKQFKKHVKSIDITPYVKEKLDYIKENYPYKDNTLRSYSEIINRALRKANLWDIPEEQKKLKKHNNPEGQRKL